MAKRKVIKIDQEKCTGCGLCIPNCPEGALQVIDGKARLVSDLFCDGLGACIGYCPEGAINIEERDAEAYDQSKAMENVVKQGKNVIKAHTHAAGSHVCPGVKIMDFRTKQEPAGEGEALSRQDSQLRNWPVQITLLPVNAPYLAGANLLISADCVPFTYASFHQDLLKGKILLVGCPKLDDAKAYEGKITQIFKANDIKSVTCAHMEVPCCFGLVNIIKSAIAASGKEIEYKEVTIGIRDPSQLKIIAGCSG